MGDIIMRTTHRTSARRAWRRVPGDLDRPRGTTLLGLVAALAVLALSACGPFVEPPLQANPAGLRAALVTGGVQLTWHVTVEGQSAGYQLEQLVDGGQWTPLADASTNEALITGLTPHTTYLFRVRHAPLPELAPAEWSPPVAVLYVELELPVIRIDTQADAPILDKENYVRSTVSIDPNGSEFAAYSGTAGVRGRGNTTWEFPKRPYRVKLDTKSPIMGLASERDWVLLANHLDRSQLRTHFAGELGRATGLDWTPTFRHVELILNGHYQGVYQLTESVEPGANRVDIAEMDSDDDAAPAVTGGYLMEIDSRLEENNEPGWRTPQGVPIVVKDPDPMSDAQRAYIQGHVAAFEQALFGPDFADPLTGYAAHLDLDDFVDHYLVQEITRNADAFWSSTYFTKERDDALLHFGPLWDFDRSVGSPFTLSPNLAEGWYARNGGPWIQRIFQDPAFVDRVAQRWSELEPIVADLTAQLGGRAAALAPAIANDASRWGYQPAEHDSATYLQGWLSQRSAWLSAELASATS